MTEKEKMLAGKIYDAGNSELAAIRTKAHNLCKKYNNTFEDEAKKRTAIINELLPNKSNSAYFQGPIFFDYGMNTSLGENFYANYNFTVLDCAKITIGNDVMIGVNCSLVTPIHPMRWQDRNISYMENGAMLLHEYSKPITIGDNCWLASNVTVIGGVCIGNGSVIGAGSVVTKDIPNNSFAVGVPCKVVREITEQDAIKLKKELW